MDQYQNNPTPIPAPEPAPAPTLQPAQPPTPQRPEPISPLAIISIVFAGLSLTSFLSLIGALFGAIAIVTAVISIVKKMRGKKLAITSIILGAIGLLLSVATVLLIATSVITLPAALNGKSNTGEKSEAPYITRARALNDSKKVFAKGETARFEYFDVKVNSVAEPFSDDSSEPDQEYVFVNVTLTNKDSISQNRPPIKLNVNGIAYKEAYLGELGNTSSFQPGQSVTGDIRYAVKSGGTSMKLQLTVDNVFNPDAKDDKRSRLVWTLAL